MRGSTSIIHVFQRDILVEPGEDELTTEEGESLRTEGAGELSSATVRAFAASASTSITPAYGRTRN